VRVDRRGCRWGHRSPVAGPERFSILRPDGDELPPTSNPPPNLVAVTVPYRDDCQFVHKCRHPGVHCLHDPCPFLLGSIGRGARRRLARASRQAALAASMNPRSPMKPPGWSWVAYAMNPAIHTTDPMPMMDPITTHRHRRGVPGGTGADWMLGRAGTGPPISLCTSTAAGDLTFT